MTDDLVKRLRKVEPDAPGERTRWYRNPDGPEAADRIEQLEAMLETVMRSAGYPDHVIRAALGEKKDDQHE